MLRSIAGFVDPDAGSIHLGGVDAAGVTPQDRSVTLLFQEPRLFPALSVADNVSFGLRVRGIDAAERDRRARELLTSVGLEDRAGDSVKGLSGGEAQRVALARALCVRPDVLLLDEPFSAVDAPRRLELRTLIADLQAEHGMTMIFVTHDIDDAIALADMVVVLADGVLGDGVVATHEQT